MVVRGLGVKGGREVREERQNRAVSYLRHSTMSAYCNEKQLSKNIYFIKIHQPTVLFSKCILLPLNIHLTTENLTNIDDRVSPVFTWQ